jgi:hypothetical protein
MQMHVDFFWLIRLKDQVFVVGIYVVKY